MPSWEDGSDRRLSEYRGETEYDEDNDEDRYCRGCGADLIGNEPHGDGCDEDPYA